MQLTRKISSSIFSPTVTATVMFREITKKRHSAAVLTTFLQDDFEWIEGESDTLTSCFSKGDKYRDLGIYDVKGSVHVFFGKLHHRGERGRKGRECKISKQSTQNL